MRCLCNLENSEIFPPMSTHKIKSDRYTNFSREYTACLNNGGKLDVSGKQEIRNC